jgi:hypothetical protein
MSDIVKRLDRIVDRQKLKPGESLVADALAEIERLRAAVKFYDENDAALVKTLRAERDELLAAAKKVNAWLHDGDLHSGLDLRSWQRLEAAIAKAERHK